MNKKCEINPNGRICVRWDVLPLNYSKENEENIRAMMAKKYDVPVSSVRVEVNLISATEGKSGIALNTENISNIKDPKFQQELFKQYIAENGIEDYDMNELVKIDSRINALINYDNYENGKRYSIKWIKWSNFLSYGDDNFFDFTKLHGLVQLSGRPANESGKSTFAYDLMHFLLFGKTNSEKAKTLENLFNNYREDCNKVELEGCITIEGQDYIIKRTLTRPEKKKSKTVTQKVEYYAVNENGFKEELLDDLKEESSTKTTKAITEALGSESDFDMIISANSKDLDSLISLKDTERGRLLTRWIGLSVLEDKDVKAREIWNKDVSKKRYCSIYNREQLNQEIETLTKNNEQETDLIKSEEKRTKDAKKEIEKLNKEITALLSKKKPIDSSLEKVDMTTLQNTIQTIIDNGKRVKQLKDAAEAELKKYGEIVVDEEHYKELVKQKDTLIDEIAVLRTDVKNLISQNTNLANAEYCPTCHRKLDGVDNSGLIAQNQAKIDEFTKTGVAKSSKLKEIEAELTKIEENRKLLREKSALELKISTYDADIIKYRSEYKENNTLLNSLNANKEAITENSKIDASINVVNTSINTQNGIISNAAYNIGCSQKNIEANNNAINERKSIIVKINEEEKEEKNWKLYLQLIGKDGISKIVLKNSLPILNGELSRLLSDVADFDVEVEVNEKNDVDFWLLRDGVKTRLAAASGLERTQAALALRVVLGKMSNLSRPPFLLLDEILGTVAKENYDKMKQLYEKIAKEYDFVLHITHLTDIADWHESSVVVVKENNISKIIG